MREYDAKATSCLATLWAELFEPVQYKLELHAGRKYVCTSMLSLFVNVKPSVSSGSMGTNMWVGFGFVWPGKHQGRG